MNWSQFFYRGGYGYYVWGSYLLALLAMGGEVLALRHRKKTLQRRLNISRNDAGGSPIVRQGLGLKPAASKIVRKEI
jgi:heme exporter protein D